MNDLDLTTHLLTGKECYMALLIGVGHASGTTSHVQTLGLNLLAAEASRVDQRQ